MSFCVDTYCVLHTFPWLVPLKLILALLILLSYPKNLNVKTYKLQRDAKQ